MQQHRHHASGQGSLCRAATVALCLNPQLHVRSSQYRVKARPRGAVLGPAGGPPQSGRVHPCRSSKKSESSAVTSRAADRFPEVKAVLFDMDGVLCNSEEVSRITPSTGCNQPAGTCSTSLAGCSTCALYTVSIHAPEEMLECSHLAASSPPPPTHTAACEVMRELYGLDVNPDEFIPFTGTGEANFLGGVARKYGAPFEVDSCKTKFFEVYMAKYAVPGAGIGYPGALDLVRACRQAGLKTAVASSADLVKVHANLGAAEIPLSLFDAVVSADAFERLKPSPDIFLAAAEKLGVEPVNCVVIEDAVAGVQAARAAGMRVLGVTTTLSVAAMEAAAPDRILAGISKIQLEDLTRLDYVQQAAGYHEVEANGSSGGASTATAAAPASGLASSAGTAASPPKDKMLTWLNEVVPLPGGYRTTRRDVLKLGSLGLGLGSLYVGLTRAKRDPSVRQFLLRYHIPTLIQLGIVAYVVLGWQYLTKSLAYVSPKALVNALLPNPGAAAAAAGAGDSSERVAAFKRYISDLEKRGGGQRAPEFAPGLDWLNAPPLKLSRELQGKVVILDFWTYCCINCIHILPDLAYLESKFEGTPMAVVGVHSAKFDNEKDSEAIRNAVLRYEISHPVVNDGNMVMWRGLGVSSWPTLAVLSPKGQLIGLLPGEGHRQDLDDILTAALEFYGEQGLLDTTPLPVALEREKDPRLAQSPLRFPGKLAADVAGGRLFISDSNNHRVVITDLDGNFLDQVGGNGPGLEDGSYAAAAFNRPQGVVYSPATNCLYVADTEAHALREVNLGARTVATLAGNGTKGNDYRGGKAGTAQSLNSPWDLALDPEGKGVLIAMAGQHQIWRYDLASGVAELFSGTGYERNQNGGANSTSWAQPSGLSLSPDARGLYVADSESSAIRRLDMGDRSSSSLVGGDAMFADNLFRFGDKDGAGTNALLQHPLAVLATEGGKVYVADSYNHRLKVLDPGSSSITMVAGSGAAGFTDGKGTTAQLSEPGGLCEGPRGTVLIADTNNSLIRRFDPGTGMLSTLQLKGVPPPRVSPDRAPAASSTGSLPQGATLVRSQQPFAAASSQLRLRLDLPPGYHLTKGANSSFAAETVGAASGVVEMSPPKGPLREVSPGVVEASLSLRRQSGTGSSAGKGAMRVLCRVYFCQDGGACLFEEVVFEVPVVAEKGEGRETGARLELSHAVSAAAPQVSLPGL